MAKQTTRIPVSSIVFDEDIYPRKGIDPRRVGIFAENIRDGFKFDPIEIEPDPDRPGKYRLLDGAHRWSAYRSTGLTETEAVIKNLDGIDSLLYAAKKAIGPTQLTENEARNTARRAYNKNPALTFSDIGKAIGRSRQTVDSYITDLRAVTRIGLDIKIFRMNRLGIPQDRIAKRLGQVRETIRDHLAKMPKLANPPKADLIIFDPPYFDKKAGSTPTSSRPLCPRNDSAPLSFLQCKGCGHVELIPLKRFRCQCTFCGHIWRIPKRRILRFERFFDIKKGQPFVWECPVCVQRTGRHDCHEGVVIPATYKNIHGETVEIDPKTLNQNTEVMRF